MRTFVKRSLIISGVLGAICLAGIGWYHLEQRAHMRQQRQSFFVEIDPSSFGTVDHMEFSICGEKSPITPYYTDEDGMMIWGDKIGTPKQLRSPQGEPCPVEIVLSVGEQTWIFPADQVFDCPDCSGIHNYIIQEENAVYRYSP